MPRDWGDVSVGPRGAIILGGNGTGKSSIVDAIEIALAGESSLYAEARQGVNWGRGSPHVIGGPADVTCTVEDNSGDEFEISLNGPTDETAATWLDVARLSKFVLRRHMLLRFIVAPPATRYQTLASFLDLATYTAVEEKLHSIADSLQASIAEHARAVETAEQNLRTGFNLESSDEIDLDSLTEQTRAAAVELGIIDDDESPQLGELAEKLRYALKDESVSTELERLAALKGTVSRLALPSTLEPQFESTRDVCVTFEKIEYEEIQLHLVAIIEASLKLLGDFAIDTCPVCESEIDREQLEENLRSRLTASEELIQAKNAVKTMVDSLSRAISEVCQAYVNFIEQSGSLSERIEWKPYLEARDFLVDAKQQLEREQKSADLVSGIEGIQRLVASHNDVLQAIDGLIEDLGGTERWKALRALGTQVDLCVSESETLRESVLNRRILAQQLSIAKRVAEHASNARKQVVSDVLNEVTETANAFYEHIHPGEGISTSRLEVRAATDASVNLICEFAGSEENPLLHFSESHLDTLGLCYFLAIRRKQADNHPEFKLVVLDDVMHSVDSDHRRRVVELLRDNFDDHQLVITTHDKVFYQNLREIFKAAEVAQHRLTDWTLERGPVLADPATDIDRITVPEIRREKSAEELAAAAGRFMESMLKKLAEGLQLSIIARFESRYTIGDIWPRLRSKLNSTASFVDSHGDLADRVNSSVWMRNEIGAHDNEEAAPPTDAEVHEFAAQLTDLYEATFCSDCRSYIRRQESGDWACRCGSIRYTR